MRVSVVVPTRHGSSRLALSCAESVTPQLKEHDELFISVDGVEPTGHIYHELSEWAQSGHGRVLAGPQSGPGATRNRALEKRTGDLILFLNDDVIASEDLVETHRSAHAKRVREGKPHTMMLGDAPWGIGDDDRVIDRLMRETSWIFFFDQMNSDQPDRDWGFRHAWTLNLSVPREICEQFDPRLAQPMFDDLEWAYRVCEKHRAGVMFLPDAKVTHHHRYEPEQLIRREVLLGHQAAHLSVVHPIVAEAVFKNKFSSRTDVDSQLEDADVELLSHEIAEFVLTATRPSDVLTAEELQRMFLSCRRWRNYFRLLGAHGYHRQIDAYESIDIAQEKCVSLLRQCKG